eukprot:scpid91188/ scgid28151/ 
MFIVATWKSSCFPSCDSQESLVEHDKQLYRQQPRCRTVRQQDPFRHQPGRRFGQSASRTPPRPRHAGHNADFRVKWDRNTRYTHAYTTRQLFAPSDRQNFASITLSTHLPSGCTA